MKPQLASVVKSSFTKSACSTNGIIEDRQGFKWLSKKKQELLTLLRFFGLYSMLLLSLDYPFLIVPSVFSNVYVLIVHGTCLRVDETRKLQLANIIYFFDIISFLKGLLSILCICICLYVNLSC